jgi:hypothetical protein
MDDPITVPVVKWVEVPVLRGFWQIEEIWELAQKHGAWIVGGYVRWMCSPLAEVVDEGEHDDLDLAPAMDVDLFPKEQQNYDTLVAAMLERGFPLTYENDICVTFRWQDDPDNEKPKIQIIKPSIEGHIKTTGTFEEVLDNFDFTVVRIGLKDDSTAIADVDFMEHEKAHKLVIKNIVCPISSVTRITKYARKGYYISVSQIIKLFVEWDERGWEYKQQVIQMLAKLEDAAELTQEEIDLAERLIRID